MAAVDFILHPYIKGAHSEREGLPFLLSCLSCQCIIDFPCSSAFEMAALANAPQIVYASEGVLRAANYLRVSSIVSKIVSPQMTVTSWLTDTKLAVMTNVSTVSFL